MKEYFLHPPEPGHSGVDYAKDLNSQQLEVVQAGDGQLLVIAGAGSGKTRTLTYRVMHLLETGVPPSSILLVTFTNKAAREMTRRVEGMMSGDVRSLMGGTFHHVGNIFLRRHAELVGHRPGFTIMDREDSKDLFSDLISKSKELQQLPKRPKGGVLLDIHSYAVNTDQDVDRVISDRYSDFLDLATEFQRIIRAYGEKKRQHNLMDFDDLLLHWRTILREHPDVLEYSRNRFSHILVDEYQDTNRIQAEIIETIAGPDGNLMVVGDDAQSVYSFRGADFGNIIDFPKRFPKCRIFKLETNYRSTPEILALSNSSISNNRRQFEKTLVPHRGEGPKPELVICGDAREQASFVAQRMVELMDEGFEREEIAILYRAHWHSMDLQMELMRRNIPYLVRSGVRFFEQAHIKDVMAWLKILANPLDEMAWKRILKNIPRVGKKTAEKIFTAIVLSPDPLGSLQSESVIKAVPRGARKGWDEVVRLVHILRGPGMQAAPSEAIMAILENGYDVHLAANFPNAKARTEDIRRFADFSLRFKNLDELLSEMLLSQSFVGEAGQEEDQEDSSVVLTTVHQAKGLEWRAVFVIWLTEGKFPDQRSVREEGGEEEERRLFYVAATRAMDELILVLPTLADEKGMIGVIQRPSAFIKELDCRTYAEMAIGYRGFGYDQ